MLFLLLNITISGGSSKKSSRSSANLGLSAVQPPPLPNPCVATPVVSIPIMEDIAPLPPPPPQIEKKPMIDVRILFYVHLVLSFREWCDVID